MRVSRSIVLLTGLVAGLWTASALAAAVEFPLASSRIQLVDSGKPSKRKVSFQAKWSGDVGSMDDPRFTSSTLRVIGGPGEGDSGLLRLAEGNWKPLGKNKGFRYADPAGNIGGIKSVMLRFAKGGGRVKITGGKDRWAYQLASAQSAITVTLTVGGRTWCAQFAGPNEKNKRGRLVASAATALAACPCDTFASTWEAIQTVIFERNGCADQACHGDAKQGGLDLRADAAYDALVNAHSDLGQMLRVRPGSQRDSFLWRKIAVARDDFKSKAEFEAELKTVPGTPMPSGRTPLRAEEVEAIGQWIQKGAPKVGVVPESDKLLNSCLPPGGPLKLPKPEPPAEGTGVQFHLPPWTIAPRNEAGQNGENEVCYSVYFDLRGKIDPQYVEACDEDYWGPGKTCFRYKKQELSQDPNSHHSIIHIYNGEYAANHPGWKNKCHGGPMNGTACDPTVPGVSAPAGDQCGEGGICHGAVVSSVACLFGFGPPDFQGGVAGNGSQTAPTFSGSQQPYFERTNPEGVYAQLPIEGTIVINSHAFNVYDVPATNEQWLNMYFATEAESLYPMRGIFDSADIFVQNVAPYKEVEYCRTALFPRGTRISELSSHTHQRGRLFRVWGPPTATITPSCRSSSQNPGSCLAEPGTPIMTTVEYNDPAQLRFDPPLALDDANDDTRRFKFCSIFDNGFTDPTEVKRNTTSPSALLGGKCFTRNANGTVTDRGIMCAEPAAKRGQLCHGNDRECDSGPGANDGVCDACTLRGGVTTEDEMFILLGSFYCAPNTPCSGVCRTGDPNHPKEGQFCNYSHAFCDSPPGEKWCRAREYNNN